MGQTPFLTLKKTCMCEKLNNINCLECNYATVQHSRKHHYVQKNYAEIPKPINIFVLYFR